MSEIDDRGAAAQRLREDEWLVVRCQLGERAAFDELIERWQGPLWTYLRRLAGDEEAAREVLQEAWLRILRGFPRLREGSKLRPWLFGIARRALMDRLRLRYGAPVEVEVEEAGTAEAAEPPSEDREADLQALEKGLAGLPLAERETLTLFYLRELSLAEVAETLRLPVGTVKSRLFRARQRLRRELTENEE